MSDPLVCWKCGASLATLLLPFGRAEVCPACNVDVRVCRMCVFFDPTRNKQCREPVVDEVRDKERSNFCDYFKPKPGAHRAGDDAAARARAELEKLFGGKS